MHFPVDSLLVSRGSRQCRCTTTSSVHFPKDSLLVSRVSRKCGCTTTASRKAVAEDFFPLSLKNTEIEWAAIHVGYVAEPPCNCILSSCLLVKFTIDAWLASLHHLLPDDFDRSHTVPVPASGAGNSDARFRGSTRRMTFIIWQRLRPWRRASPKAMHSLGFSAALFGLLVSPCAFWTLKLRSFRALGAFLGPGCRCQTQCHVPRKPFATTHLHR